MFLEAVGGPNIGKAICIRVRRRVCTVPNSRCQHVREPTVWGTCSAPPRMRTTAPPYSAWMASAHMIMCSELPCWDGWPQCLVVFPECCRLCVWVARASPRILGGMTRVSGGQSFRQKERNKVTPSCRSCSRSGFKPLWRRSARPQKRVQLCAFLDDVFALCDPQRVKVIHDTLAECLWRVAGIQLHREKTKVWNEGRVPPPHVDHFGVGRHQGLGNTHWSAAFTRERMMTRIVDEQASLGRQSSVPDLQRGWQLLLQSAGPRANHMIRTVPPELSSEYASEHDEGMWRTAVALLGQLPGTPEQLDRVKMVASLPMGWDFGRQVGVPGQPIWLRGPTRSPRSASAIRQSPTRWSRV